MLGIYFDLFFLIYFGVFLIMFRNRFWFVVYYHILNKELNWYIWIFESVWTWDLINYGFVFLDQGSYAGLINSYVCLIPVYTTWSMCMHFNPKFERMCVLMVWFVWFYVFPCNMCFCWLWAYRVRVINDN